MCATAASSPKENGGNLWEKSSLFFIFKEWMVFVDQLLLDTVMYGIVHSAKLFHCHTTVHCSVADPHHVDADSDSDPPNSREWRRPTGKVEFVLHILRSGWKPSCTVHELTAVNP